MKAFIIYVLGDYASAIGITQNYGVAKQYEQELISHGCNAWIEEIKISNKLTKLGE